MISNNYEIELQKESYNVWDAKYRLKDINGFAVDQTINDTFERVAGALANVESKKQEYWKDQFVWAMKNGAVPAGRILSNAGAGKHKPNTSLINCVVSGTIDDSMDGILKRLHEAGLTLKAGCGIGYDFSTLRPKGAIVNGVGASTSGPLSFMDVYDKLCATVSSAGGRRGAQMATMDIRHPDIMQYIQAKRESGRLRHFNLSVLITKEFMEAVRRKDTWNLFFPCNDEGMIYKIVSACDLFDQIMQSNYDYAEPGFLLIDEINKMNNNWYCETIQSTNPCGEQPLPPYGACLLGSINLTKFIFDPFTENARFDYGRYSKVIRLFTRMLDNVVEIHGLPLKEQAMELESKRRHGMGYFGLGSAMAMMGMRYGSEKSLYFTHNVTKYLAVEGLMEGLMLAREKGAAPLLNKDIEVNEFILENISDQDQSFIHQNKIPSKVLMAASPYMQRIAKVDADLVAAIKVDGCRFTHHSSIAPTGTIALSLGNNASNGIEPSFAHHYTRNMIVEGKKTKEKIDVESYEALLYHSIHGNIELPDYFVTADELTPYEHINVQSEAQYWIDSSISKTVNVPSDCSFERFKNIYLYAYKKGLKGCSTFRFNPDNFQGVLVRDKDLQNTIYHFKTDQGETVSVQGDEMVEYDGDVHGAANLFEALKEQQYGKF